MLAVILDIKNKEIFDYLGVNSFFSLSLINVELGEHLVTELKYSGIENVVVYGDNKGRFANYTSDFSELSLEIENCKSENIFVFFSNTFFELSPSIKNIDSLNLSSLSISDKNGNMCGYVFEKNHFIEKFNGLKADDIYKNIIKYKGYTRISGADYVYCIDSLASYKNLLTVILNNNTSITLPEIAEGIYAKGQINKGDFVIIPPVYIGKDVQIESDCIIGPDCIISDNTLVSKNSYIKSSVLLNDNYVSSGCFLENVLSCENASVLRNSAVFSGSVLGHHSYVSEETFLENNSKIRAYARTGDYINRNEKGSLYCFNGCLPEYAALIGGALGTLFKGKKIGVLTDGEINSVSLKYALFSGMISTGIKCFDIGESYLGALFTYINSCELDYGIYIKGGFCGVSVCIINHLCEYISKDMVMSIKDIISKNSIERATEKECYNIRKLNGLKRLYVHKILSSFENELGIFPVFNCSDKYVEVTLNDIMSKLSFSMCNEQIIFDINDDATSVICRHKNKHISHSNLLDFVSFYSNNLGDCVLDNWRYDAVFLVFKVLNIITELHLDISSEINNLPSFYVAEKTIDISEDFSYIVGKLSEKYNVGYKNNELIFNTDGVNLKIIKNDNEKIKIIAHSLKVENSEEIAGDIARYLLNI